ncbi:MAG: lysine--tRNA ligase [Candidatus Diapherotrites archaeon]
MSEEKEVSVWSEKVADDVIVRHKEPYVVEGMWTPSGFFHIGNARPEVFTPYAVKRAIQDKGKKVTQNFILDDFDAVRKIPGGLGIKKEDEDKYLGFPIATAPSPLPGFKTWADAFVSQLKKYAPEFGLDLNFISAFQTYKEGKFNELIKFSIENSKEIVKVWTKVAGSEKEEDFVPLQVLCEKCKKIYYTKVLGFENDLVEYECECGQKGKVSPYDGNAKLHWRVHWVCHWILHKVDFESGGKDHFSKGGSVDVGQALIKEVFKKEPPVQVPTEFVQLAGAKMAGSIGNVIDLESWLKVAPPELFRFMNFSYKPYTVIEFSFKNNSFVLLNDRFERAERIYFGFEKAENEKMTQKLKKIYEFSVIGTPSKRLVQLPFSTSILLSQILDFENNFDESLDKIKEVSKIPEDLTNEEKEKIKEKLKRTKHWVENYAEESFRLSFVEEYDSGLLGRLDEKIVSVLTQINKNLLSAKTQEEIQQLIFDSSKENNISPKDSFRVIYLALIGKEKGPKVGSLVPVFGKEKVMKRIEEVISQPKPKTAVREKKDSSLPGAEELSKVFNFEVSEKVKENFPNLRLGILVLKNIANAKQSPEISKLLRKKESELRKDIEGKELSSVENLKLWREAYSSFGGKPKKYKPSVEALVKRVVKGEELPSINLLVDIYNYISIKYLLPAGGDDLDKIEGKVSLDYATGKENFLMIGSNENDAPKEGEIVYKDSKEVLCRRWNWRECDKTKLTEETKNAVIYIESLSSADDLDKALAELAELVEKYCNAKTSKFVV